MGRAARVRIAGADFGLSDAHLRITHAEVAAQPDLEAGARRRPVEGSDRGFVEGAHGAVHPMIGGEPCSDIVDAVRRGLAEVLPAAERALSGTRDDHRPDRVVGIRRGQRSDQAGAQRGVDRVHRRRAMQCQNADDSAGVFD
jgi:hypothetical protein